MANKLLVCGFYTESYRDDFERLEISLNRFGMEYSFTQVDPQACWEATTGLKPSVLLQCLLKNPDRDVLYVDADAFIRREIANFDEFTGDIGIHFNEDGGKRASHTIRTGTIFLRNTEATRAFLSLWIAKQAQSDRYCDQDSFQLAYDEPHVATFFNLPVEYVKIYDKDNVKSYIEHFQASRRHEDDKAVSRKRQKKIRNVLLLLVNFTLYVVFYYLGGL
ncbi:putative nucleotide-diphospho-sugar transferase [Thalassolituus sp. LLYu03]|uniref:putative nucleotide-diphospho-sugar transferase n=1 Tax=Thalassolituus sp. LLYu03 TaxID=3421656 RepID=UPI003D2AC355